MIEIPAELPTQLAEACVKSAKVLAAAFPPRYARYLQNKPTGRFTPQNSDWPALEAALPFLDEKTLPLAITTLLSNLQLQPLPTPDQLAALPAGPKESTLPWVPVLSSILEAQTRLACARLCAEHHTPAADDTAANALSKLNGRFNGLAGAIITTTLARHLPAFTAAMFRHYGDRSMSALKTLCTIHSLPLSEAKAMLFAKHTR
jgi:hypothetical protein